MPDGHPLFPKWSAFLPESPAPATLLTTIIEMIGDARSVLDIGCSLPELDRLLGDAGATVTGITAASDENAHGAACSRAIAADLDFDSLPALLAGETFDAVFAGDVLERLHDPVSVLDGMRALLKPGGSAIVALRNSEHGAILLRERAGDLEYGAYGILDGSHLRFFTRDTIEALLVRAGYALERVETTAVALFAPAPMLPAVDAADFDAATIAAVRRNRDAETYEFIALATPLDDVAKMAQLQKQYVTAGSKLVTAQATIAELNDELARAHDELAGARDELAGARSGFTRERAMFEVKVRELEALRGRAADNAGGLEAELEAAKTELAQSERELERARSGYVTLAERFDTLTAERRSTDAHCLNLIETASLARARALAAERALHRYLAPLADAGGSLETALERRDRLTHIDRYSGALMAQLDTLDSSRNAGQLPPARSTFQQLARGARRLLES